MDDASRRAARWIRVNLNKDEYWAARVGDSVHLNRQPQVRKQTLPAILFYAVEIKGSAKRRCSECSTYDTGQFKNREHCSRANPKQRNCLNSSNNYSSGCGRARNDLVMCSWIRVKVNLFYRSCFVAFRNFASDNRAPSRNVSPLVDQLFSLAFRSNDRKHGREGGKFKMAREVFLQYCYLHRALLLQVSTMLCLSLNQMYYSQEQQSHAPTKKSRLRLIFSENYFCLAFIIVIKIHQCTYSIL